MLDDLPLHRRKDRFLRADPPGPGTPFELGDPLQGPPVIGPDTVDDRLVVVSHACMLSAIKEKTSPVLTLPAA